MPDFEIYRLRRNQTNLERVRAPCSDMMAVRGVLIERGRSLHEQLVVMNGGLLYCVERGDGDGFAMVQQDRQGEEDAFWYPRVEIHPTETWRWDSGESAWFIPAFLEDITVQIRASTRQLGADESDDSELLRSRLKVSPRSLSRCLWLYWRKSKVDGIRIEPGITVELTEWETGRPQDDFR